MSCGTNNIIQIRFEMTNAYHHPKQSHLLILRNFNFSIAMSAWVCFAICFIFWISIIVFILPDDLSHWASESPLLNFIKLHYTLKNSNCKQIFRFNVFNYCTLRWQREQPWKLFCTFSAMIINMSLKHFSLLWSRLLEGRSTIFSDGWMHSLLTFCIIS